MVRDWRQVKIIMVHLGFNLTVICFLPNDSWIHFKYKWNYMNISELNYSMTIWKCAILKWECSANLLSINTKIEQIYHKNLLYIFLHSRKEKVEILNTIIYYMFYILNQMFTFLPKRKVWIWNWSIFLIKVSCFCAFWEIAKICHNLEI